MILRITPDTPEQLQKLHSLHAIHRQTGELMGDCAVSGLIGECSHYLAAVVRKGLRSAACSLEEQRSFLPVHDVYGEEKC